jgi:mannitol operon transcriptional antiterminator
VVVCPAGVATAWILVSRIQAEFPELELVQVVAADSFEQRDSVDADLIISTVPIESASGEGKVVVVNPLLPADDVRRLARSL